MSETSQSVTYLIRAVQGDRASAVGPLLAIYFERLVQLARRRLQNVPGMDGYEEDLALRSFLSVYENLRDPARRVQPDSRDDLWRLLAARTISRAIDLIRKHRPAEAPGDHDLERFLAREPTPEEAAEMADECRRLLDLLEEPQLRQIALWKVEGFTNEEIASKLDCVLRTVERKVMRIRMLWKHELKDLEP